MINCGIKRFVSCLVPVYACNFRCSYCYVGHHQGAYTHGIKPFFRDAQYIADFFSIERMGGPCYFNLCGAGETLMHPQIVDLVDCLTREGHYTDIITNGVITQKFQQIIDRLEAEQKKRLFIKFSFHYEQLVAKKLLERFTQNVHMIRDAGISYTVEITPHDELVPFIEEIKAYSMEHFEALPHITVTRNEATKAIELMTGYSREEFKRIWSSFDSDLFDFKFSIFNVKRCEFCYAGDWSIYVNLMTGTYQQCYGGDILGSMKDMDKPLNFRAIGKCRQPHCWNGHAFLAYGDIPELSAPTYADMRDRITAVGSHWLQDQTREFFSTRLKDSNREFSSDEKRKLLVTNRLLYLPRIVKNAYFYFKKVRAENADTK